MLLILHDDLFALGTAGGGNIGRCDKRGVLSAQKFCISEQIRWFGFPALRQPIDPIVTLQGAALHFTAAVWTNHILTLSVPGGFCLPGTPVIFAAACTWRKFPDSAALGGALTIFRSGGASPLRNSDARATGRGSSAVRERGGYRTCCAAKDGAAGPYPGGDVIPPGKVLILPRVLHVLEMACVSVQVLLALGHLRVTHAPPGAAAP